MILPAQMVPLSDNFYNTCSSSLCPDCLDPVDLCTCSWQIMQLDASYSIYTALNEDMNKQPSASTAAASLLDNKMDGLNCGGIPTRTTPTLTPTTLRSITADIESLTPGPPEDFAAAAASDLHHLVSSTINVSSSGSIDRLNSDLQDRHSLQTLGIQHLNLQTLNNQHTIGLSLHNQQNLNPNSLNQQQRDDYNNSFSSAASRQAGFVPPLVLQISSSHTTAQQSSGTTILINSNSSLGTSSVFCAKGSSTSTSSSHWQGAVVTQRPQRRSRSATRRQFTDDEDVDEDYDSAADDGTDSSDTTSGKMSRKQNMKNNKSSSKSNIKNEFKNTANTTNSGRRSNKDNILMSAEEEQRRQIRRERNKLAAARCRKRRMDHTNELLEETEQLEEKRLRLQVEIQSLRQQKTDLQHMLAQHKCAVNMTSGSVSNSVSAINHTTTAIDSNAESNTAVLCNNLSTIKRDPLQQQNLSTNVDRDNKCNIVDDVLIKREDHSGIQPDEDNKDNIDIIPTTVLQPTVLQQPQRRRPTTLLQLNNGNFGNSKKVSENGSSTNVVLNFDSLMDGGTGLTPVSTTVGNVQNHHQQVQHGVTGSSSNGNSVLS